MNTNLWSTIAKVVGLGILLATILYLGYFAWFKPSVFKDKEVKKVKDWWPFANYFRSYHGSSEYLWAVRIMTLVTLLIVIAILCLALLGILGLFP